MVCVHIVRSSGCLTSTLLLPHLSQQPMPSLLDPFSVSIQYSIFSYSINGESRIPSPSLAHASLRLQCSTPALLQVVAGTLPRPFAQHWLITMQCSTVQYSTAQYSTVQYSTRELISHQCRIAGPLLLRACLALMPAVHEAHGSLTAGSRLAHREHCALIVGSRLAHGWLTSDHHWLTIGALAAVPLSLHTQLAHG